MTRLLARIAPASLCAAAAAAPTPAPSPRHGEDVYHTPFYRRFRAVVTWCVTHRWVVIGDHAWRVFVLSIAGFGLVQQQFFPSANRPELVVDLWLPSGASIVATDREAKRFEQLLEADPDVDSYVVYVGGGSPRFYLPLDQQLFNANLAEFVVTTRSNEVRDAVAERLLDTLDSQFTLLRGRVQPAAERPAGGLSGPVPHQRPRLRPAARLRREDRRRSCARIRTWYHVHLDWNELAKVVRLEIDQNKARLIGVASQALSNVLNSILTGFSITQYRERDKLIEVLARAESARAAQPGGPVLDQRPDPERALDPAVADRHRQVRIRGGAGLAAQPRAHHHGARRYRRRHPGAGGVHADRPAARCPAR